MDECIVEMFSIKNKWYSLLANDHEDSVLLCATVLSPVIAPVLLVRNRSERARKTPYSAHIDKCRHYPSIRRAKLLQYKHSYLQHGPCEFFPNK